LKLFYRKTGNGPMLLILHGLFGSSDNWVSIARQLSDNFTVIVPDERNHGRSPHSDIFDYNTLRDDALELLHDTGIDQAYVAGHSMGGKVAIEMAIYAPEIVKKLVILDISPRKYPLRHQFILQGLNALDIGNMKTRQEADEQLSGYIQNQNIRQFLLKNLSRKKNGGFKWKINLPVIEASLHHIGEAQTSEHPISTPALFIGGKNSDYIGQTDEQQIHTLFSNARVEMIPDAGHWLHAEQPVKICRLIKNFLLEN